MRRPVRGQLCKSIAHRHDHINYIHQTGRSIKSTSIPVSGECSLFDHADARVGSTHWPNLQSSRTPWSSHISDFFTQDSPQETYVVLAKARLANRSSINQRRERVCFRGYCQQCPSDPRGSQASSERQSVCDGAPRL